MKQKNILAIITLIVIFSSVYLAIRGNNNDKSINGSEQELNLEAIPLQGLEIEAPTLELPIGFELFESESTHIREDIGVTRNLYSIRFVDCILKVSGFDNLNIEECQLINSRIHIVECVNITFINNYVVDYYVEDDPAILVQNVHGLNFSSNLVYNNSIGMVVSGGSDIDIGFNVFEACDQHNAIMGLNSNGARIHNNVFRYNFPHALMIMNREENPDVQLEIYENLFDRNIEDAINFEDFRGASEPSLVYSNIINGTGQAGINVEYNSWNANIVIKENYVMGNGLLTSDILDENGRPNSIYPSHGHQPEPYCEGWKHGIKLEDCSGVSLEGNIIAGNSGCGVECTNARDIYLKENVITENENGVSLRRFDEGSFHREFSPLKPSNAGASTVIRLKNTMEGNHNGDWLVEEGCQIKEIPVPLFSVSPIDVGLLSSIIPLGALSPPSHVFPTDHIYFVITRSGGADRPCNVSVYAPGDLIVTSIRVTEHVKAGITDYVLFLEPPEFPEISVMFIHISTLDEDLFGDISDYREWSFDSEYSTGDETYRTWSKGFEIEVKAGKVIGKAGGNPGQWALDLGVYDERVLPDHIANIDRWRDVRYLHSVCPLNYYEEGAVRDVLFSLVQGKEKTWTQTTCGSVLQDIPGTAQGCWFLEGVEETYPEDPHLALVYSNVNQSMRVLSVGTSVRDLDSRRYELTPESSGLINREFKDVTPDGKIYGYDVEGFEGLIIMKMHDDSTLWIEAIQGCKEPKKCSFTDNKTTFIR